MASKAFCQEPGTLGEFEKSVQPPPDKPAPKPAAREPSRDQEHHDDDLGDDLARFIVDTTAQIVADAGRQTLQRLDSGVEEAGVRRDDGDILIPFVRYDFAYQNITSTINAASNRLEAGYGPFALMFEHYVFTERNPNSTLTMDHTMLLYRMSMSKAAEVDFGLGSLDIAGAQLTTLGTVSLPVKLALAENVLLEFRPVWAGTMDDYELALHWGRPYWSVKVGYRTLNSATNSLHGPFAGFSLHY